MRRVTDDRIIPVQTPVLVDTIINILPTEVQCRNFQAENNPLTVIEMSQIKLSTDLAVISQAVFCSDSEQQIMAIIRFDFCDTGTGTHNGYHFRCKIIIICLVFSNVIAMFRRCWYPCG